MNLYNADGSYNTSLEATIPGTGSVLVNAVALASGNALVVSDVNNGVPPGTSITASSTGTTGAISATLPGVSGKTTYITGFTVSSSGATLGSNPTVTVTGTISGTLNYVYPVATLSVAQSPLDIQFSCPIPASASNTPIVVNLNTGIGLGGTAAAVTVTGFQL
jgi:hypothetical protein